MGLIQKVKDFFNRGRYNMQTSNLNSILDHPKIAVSQEEYSRIQHNLTYYQSKFDDVEYINSEGDVKRRKFNHLPISRTASKKIASLVYNEQAEITSDNKSVDEFISYTLDNDRFNKNFERYLESGLALGGLAMRPYVDGDRIRSSTSILTVAIKYARRVECCYLD